MDYGWIMMDYRGFGKTEVKNQATLFIDAQYVYQWIMNPMEADGFYMESLGSGMSRPRRILE